MLGRFALVTILALTCIAVAACGGGSTSPSTTPAGGSPSLTAAPGTPTPVPSTTVWQISGQFTATPSMSVFFCAPIQGYYEVLFTGQVNGELLNVSLFTSHTGTLDYANAASAMTIYAALSSTGNSATSVWQETAGNRGVHGTVVLSADGTGSMSGIVVPPSSAAPGVATTNVTLNGEWKCSTPSPSP
jgi:hypothetical protein